ncbi:MAG: hypothetical protein GX601_00750, partial [Anaerolineales bacterium]|nr:hypothetical protein [Anaerolineales bacterium]
GFAGTCYAHYYGPDNRPFLPRVWNAGSRHDRIDFRWDAILRDGVYNYSGYDDLVEDDLAAGIDLVGILWATPAALRKPGCIVTAGAEPAERPAGWYAPQVGALALSPTLSDQGACPPAGLYNSWSPTNFNGNHWAEFVYKTALRYRGQVRAWEIWNEVEWSFFWLGTEAEYAQLLKVAYQAIKLADPTAPVLFAGLHFWADPTYFERVLDIINDDPAAAANNYFFDVMSIHLYSRPSTVYDITLHIRQRMRQYVSDHPIWLTETGVPVYDGPFPGVHSEYAAREVEAASYLIQSYANARAAGIERYHWFRVHDDSESMGAEHFGLWHTETYTRPAYTAYQVATSYLLSPTMVTHWTYSNGVRRVTFWGTPRGKVSVLWSNLPQQATYTESAILSSATLVDQRGGTQTLTPVDGLYTVTLPPATATRKDSNPVEYIIGGEPYLLVEADSTPPPPVTMVSPVAATTYSDTIMVSWTPSSDASGIWGYDVIVKVGAAPWTQWRSFGQSGLATTVPYTDVVHGQTYCFRVRAWDRAGNRVEWPQTTRACTTIDLDREVRLDVNAVMGNPGSGPLTPLTNVSLRFVDGNLADAVPPTVGGSWHWNVTLMAGDYALWATPAGWWSPPPGWLPLRLPITVPPGPTTLTLSYPQLVLPAHRHSYWLPIAMRP